MGAVSGTGDGSGAAIRVTRDSARSKDKKLAYTVFVDDNPAAELERGETKDLPVPPGDHRVLVSAELEQSREWRASPGPGQVVSFVCRSRSPKTAGRVDLYVADPGDERAVLVPVPDLPDRDMARKQRVVTRDGTVLTVWAHRSGYLRSLEGGDAADGDAFLVLVAYWILVMPWLALVRWVRHRLLFKGGWSVGVVRDRRFLWPKKVRLERLGSEAEARVRAAEVIAELEEGPPA